jgi:3-oxoacyl-(acyl-carrier-protein) synthase
MESRVFVTGLGIISAMGNGIQETLDSFRKLEPGIGPLSLFNSVHQNIPVGEVKYTREKLAEMAGVEDPRLYTRNTLLALIATAEALHHANWESSQHEDSGLIMATTVGGMDLNEQYYHSLLNTGMNKELIGVLDSGDCTEKVAALAGIRHYITTVSTACSSSANAIMLGARLIRANRLNRVLVGGCDALTRFTLNGFHALEILSETGCRPFDENRNGLSIGEGAAVLTLESEKNIQPDRIICEVTGYCNANEAFHVTASSADGSGALMAMQGALEMARLMPRDIGYVNAHGTGTEINDLSEGRAMLQLFGRRIPPMSSTKGFTGHTLGAAGAIEAVFSALALKEQMVLPGYNFTTPMKELGFFPATEIYHGEIQHVMSNSFGFGGNNTSLIFSKS